MKRGRPHKPYRTAKGKYIDGLARRPDGRWRVLETGQIFSEPDETRAIAKFRAMMPSTQVGVPINEFEPENSPDRMVQYVFADELLLWQWLKDQLARRPGYVAERLGIPSLAHLAEVKESIGVATIERAYRQHAPVTERTKEGALACVHRLKKFTAASDLEQLTTTKLLAFRKVIESDRKLKSAGTRKAYYGRIKSVISFGKKCGLDTKTIDDALSRMSVLWTAEMTPPPKPHPISRENFHTLLEAANPRWKLFLLLGLNCCMSMDEVCDLKWDDFDLAAGTYAALRGKTVRKRIPRVAMLWPEVVEKLKALPRKGRYVFVSKHGTRFNRNTAVNRFRKFADTVGLKNVTFNQIRDGAYSAAARGTTDSRQARVLAGHAADGWEDNYVLRNPDLAAQPCQSVYNAYFGLRVVEASQQAQAA